MAIHCLSQAVPSSLVYVLNKEIHIKTICVMRNYQIMRYLLIVCWIIGNMPSGWAAEGGSTYTQRPDDPEAFYFTPENYGFKADGKSDVTDALQEAINQVKREKNFGILFLPEGNYRISKTIQIPSSIRLIGYGKKRPVIYLGADTPGFQTTQII